MQGRISIPPIAEFRAHIMAAVTFLEGYMLSVEGGLMPADAPLAKGIPGIISRHKVHALKEKFAAAPPDEKVPMTETESVQLSACYLLLSRLLVSEEGEAFCERLYNMKVEGEEAMPVKDFEGFRNVMLVTNDHLIADSDRMISEAEGYAEMKERINALEE